MRNKPLKWSIRADASAELILHGPIGSSFWETGISAKEVTAIIRDMEKRSIKELNVRIDSVGGSVFDGQTIYNALASSSIPKINAVVEGIAASAASLILMAADHIAMHAHTQLMIHEARVGRSGTADELEKDAALLRKLNAQFAEVYAKRSGQSLETIAGWMHEETWFTPTEALEVGFSDEVLKPARGVRAPARTDARTPALATPRRAATAAPARPARTPAARPARRPARLRIAAELPPFDFAAARKRQALRGTPGGRFADAVRHACVAEQTNEEIHWNVGRFL